MSETVPAVPTHTVGQTPAPVIVTPGPNDIHDRETSVLPNPIQNPNPLRGPKTKPIYADPFITKSKYGKLFGSQYKQSSNLLGTGSIMQHTTQKIHDVNTKGPIPDKNNGSLDFGKKLTTESKSHTSISSRTTGGVMGKSEMMNRVFFLNHLGPQKINRNMFMTATPFKHTAEKVTRTLDAVSKHGPRNEFGLYDVKHLSPSEFKSTFHRRVETLGNPLLQPTKSGNIIMLSKEDIDKTKQELRTEGRTDRTVNKLTTTFRFVDLEEDERFVISDDDIDDPLGAEPKENSFGVPHKDAIRIDAETAVEKMNERIEADIAISEDADINNIDDMIGALENTKEMKAKYVKLMNDTLPKELKATKSELLEKIEGYKKDKELSEDELKELIYEAKLQYKYDKARVKAQIAGIKQKLADLDIDKVISTLEEDVKKQTALRSALSSAKTTETGPSEVKKENAPMTPEEVSQLINSAVVVKDTTVIKKLLQRYEADAKDDVADLNGKNKTLGFIRAEANKLDTGDTDIRKTMRELLNELNTVERRNDEKIDEIGGVDEDQLFEIKPKKKPVSVANLPYGLEADDDDDDDEEEVTDKAKTKKPINEMSSQEIYESGVKISRAGVKKLLYEALGRYYLNDKGSQNIPVIDEVADKILGESKTKSYGNLPDNLKKSASRGLSYEKYMDKLTAYLKEHYAYADNIDIVTSKAQQMKHSMELEGKLKSEAEARTKQEASEAHKKELERIVPVNALLSATEPDKIATFGLYSSMVNQIQSDDAYIEALAIAGSKSNGTSNFRQYNSLLMAFVLKITKDYYGNDKHMKEIYDVANGDISKLLDTKDDLLYSSVVNLTKAKIIEKYKEQLKDKLVSRVNSKFTELDELRQPEKYEDLSLKIPFLNKKGKK